MRSRLASKKSPLASQGQKEVYVFTAKAFLACVLLTATTGEAGVGKPGPFQLDIGVFPEKEVMPYDPIFFRVFLTNKGKETVLAYVYGGVREGRIAIQLLGENPGSSLQYPRKRASGALSGSDPRPIPAGEAFMLYLSYVDIGKPLCVQPPSPGGEPFWREIGSEFRVRVDTSVTAAALGRPLAAVKSPESVVLRQNRYMEAYGERIDVRAISPKIRVRPRPAAELRLIEEAIKNAEERNRPLTRDEMDAANEARENGEIVRERFPRPYPESCLTLVPDRYNTPTGLKDYEKQLSPGTLRDTVHFYRLMRTLYEEGDESKGLALVDELLAWLSTLPEVERHSLAVQVESILRSNKMKQKVYFELLYGLADRLPARYQMDDYRDFYFKTCCPGYAEAFAAFLRAKGERYPWIDQWLNPTPAPAKTTPSGNAPTPAATKNPASEKSPATTQPGRKN
jgi:hypothetical protein